MKKWWYMKNSHSRMDNTINEWQVVNVLWFDNEWMNDKVYKW